MYISSIGLTTNQACAAVVAALQEDLEINNFTFGSFPEVSATWTGSLFSVSLKARVVKVGPVLLRAHDVRMALWGKHPPGGTGLLAKIQPLVIELEHTYHRRRESPSQVVTL